MTNTNILCPECFMGRIFTEDNKIGNCNKCGTKFSILGENRVKYYTSKATKQSIYDFIYRKLYRVPKKNGMNINHTKTLTTAIKNMIILNIIGSCASMKMHEIPNIVAKWFLKNTNLKEV